MNDCMLFAGYKSAKGYGRLALKVDGVWKSRQLHREMYIAAKGDIPTGLVIDHLCREPACFNPDHLEAVTNSTNITRGNRPGVYNTRCNRGHLLSEVGVNVYKDGRRSCKACRSENNRMYLDKNREARKQYMKSWHKRRNALKV